MRRKEEKIGRRVKGRQEGRRRREVRELRAERKQEKGGGELEEGSD